MKKDSAKKYPPTITTLPIIQPSTLPITLPSEVRLVNPLCEIRPAKKPSSPLTTNVKGANIPNPPKRSESEDPTAPEIPPITGPKVSAVVKIIMSPKLKYPPVEKIGN